MRMHDSVDVDARIAGLGAQPRYGAMAAQVLLFLSRLRRIPLSSWDQCADGRTDMEAPRARLSAALGTMPEVTARIVRRIDEELTVAEGILTPDAVDRMRASARQAACALAARPSLAPSDFERLYAPFATVIPLGEHADAPAPEA